MTESFPEDDTAKLTPEQRRSRVSNLMVRGIRSSDRIAEILGNVTGRTIRRDIEWLEDQFRRQASEDIALVKAIDVERVERVIMGVLPKALRGEVGSARVFKELIERKAKMLGYDEPDKVQQAIGIIDAREVPEAVAALSDAQVRQLYDQVTAPQLPTGT